MARQQRILWPTKYKRIELIGHEGGPPPIWIDFYERDTDKLVGVYVRESLYKEPFTLGPMFGKEPISDG
jgi:hypothetical protein